MRRAVAYMRLDDTGRNAEEAQRAAIRTWAARESVDVKAWEIDTGIDGATPIAERPGLVAAYRALVDHDAGMLVAANADRFGQDELVCWLIERAALTQGATVHTADGSRGPVRARTEDPEASEAWTRGAIDLARAFERVTFRARIRASLAERRARGQRIGNVPYGFRLAADGVHIEPDEAEQAVIAAVHGLSVEGLSQRAIVTKLAERGVAGRTGAPLRQTQVAKILRAS